MPDNFELIQENRITARKRSLGQGNIFKSVRLSTGGGCYDVTSCYGQHFPSLGCYPPPRTAPPPLDSTPLDSSPPLNSTTPGHQASGTHPTGMLCCFRPIGFGFSRQSVWLQINVFSIHQRSYRLVFETELHNLLLHVHNLRSVPSTLLVHHTLLSWTCSLLS